MEFIRYNLKLLIKRKRILICFIFITLFSIFHCVKTINGKNDVLGGYHFVFNRKYIMLLLIPCLTIVIMYIIDIFNNISIILRICNRNKFISKLLCLSILISATYSIYTIFPVFISCVYNKISGSYTDILKLTAHNSFNFYIFISIYIFIYVNTYKINVATLIFLIGIYTLDFSSILFFKMPILLESFFYNNVDINVKIILSILLTIINYYFFKFLKKDVY